MKIYQQKIGGVLSAVDQATSTTIEDPKNISKNPNTVKALNFGRQFGEKWCLEKRIADEIEKYEPPELNTLLKQFYAEIKNNQD